MTAHELTLMALAETNRPVHAALEAAGCNRAAQPCIGYLGWLPEDDLVDLARAALMAHQAVGTEFNAETPEQLAGHMRDEGSWIHPRDDRENERIRATVVAFVAAKGFVPGVAWNLVLRLRARAAA